MKRHVPLRRCVACRSARPKHELIRVVRTPGGCVEVDHTGKAAGRGAYLCRAAECVEIAVRKQALRRALGQALPEQTAEHLRLAAAGAPPADQVGADNCPPAYI